MNFLKKKEASIAYCRFPKGMVKNDTLFTLPWQLQKFSVSPIAPYFKKTVPKADFAQAVPNHYE